MTISRPLAPVRWCLLLAALTQFAWPLQFLVGSDLDPRESFISELFARDQPYSEFLRLVDGVGGAAALAAAVLAALVLRGALGAGRGARGERPGTRVRVDGMTVLAVAGLGVFGAATLVDALSPMSCAPSISESCAAAEEAWLLPFTHYLHTVSSSVSVGGLLTSLVAAVLVWRARGAGGGGSVDADRRLGGRPAAEHTTQYRLFVLAVAALVLTTVWTVLEIVLPGAAAVGWAQRVQITVSGIALALLPAAVLLPETALLPESAPRPDTSLPTASPPPAASRPGIGGEAR